MNKNKSFCASCILKSSQYLSWSWQQYYDTVSHIQPNVLLLLNDSSHIRFSNIPTVSNLISMVASNVFIIKYKSKLKFGTLTYDKETEGIWHGPAGLHMKEYIFACILSHLFLRWCKYRNKRTIQVLQIYKRFIYRYTNCL